MDLNKENLKKIRKLVLFTIIALVIIWKFDVFAAGVMFVIGILSPFILGGILAFIMNVPMSFIERKLFASKKCLKSKFITAIKRPLCLLLTILMFTAAITLVIFFIVPQLSTTVVSLGSDIQNFAIELKDWSLDYFKHNEDITKWLNSLEFNWQKIIETTISFFKTGVGSVIDVSFSTAKSIINGIVTFFVGFVFAIYILVQKEKLRVQIKKVLYAFISPIRVKKILDISALTYKTFASFLTGQCIEAIILGLMFVITMSIVRLPFALLIGMIIAVTALIPIFGAFIGCGLGAFLILMEEPVQSLIFIVLFLVLQQVEGNIIYPRVVGNSVGLPSIWVLVAVSVGGSLMGIFGILLFIPMTSVLYTLFKDYVNKKLKDKKMKIKLTE